MERRKNQNFVWNDRLPYPPGERDGRSNLEEWGDGFVDRLNRPDFNLGDHMDELRLMSPDAVEYPRQSFLEKAMARLAIGYGLVKAKLTARRQRKYFVIDY